MKVLCPKALLFIPQFARTNSGKNFNSEVEIERPANTAVVFVVGA